MRPLTLLAGLLAAAVAYAADSDVSAFRAAERGGQIRLTSLSFDKLVSAPRNYSVTVLLTAMAPQYKCGPCVQFAPEHAAVAQSWRAASDKMRKSDPNAPEHFFGVLDFSEGREVFAKLGLQSAPVLQYYAPTAGPRKGNPNPESYDFSRGFVSEPFAQFLNSRGLPFTFKRPVDMAKVGLTITFAATAIGAVVFFGPTVYSILQYKYLWSIIFMPLILLMTSGYMWNKIRHPGYVQPTREGQVNYIARGYSVQLGVETHIVSAIYGVLAFSAYTLAYTIPKLRDPVRQRLGVYIWTGIFVVVAGLLMNLFSIKQGGYPFRIF